MMHGKECHRAASDSPYHQIPWIPLLLPIFFIIVMSIFWILSFPIVSQSPSSSKDFISIKLPVEASSSPSSSPSSSLLSFKHSIHTTATDSPESSLMLNITDNDDDDPFGSRLTSLIGKQMRSIVRIIRSGSDDLPPNDPLNLPPFWIVLNENEKNSPEKGEEKEKVIKEKDDQESSAQLSENFNDVAHYQQYPVSGSDSDSDSDDGQRWASMNVTVDRVQIRGLSTLNIKDIATNSVARSVSVLVRFKSLTITGSYKIEPSECGGHWQGTIKKQNQTISDSGKFRIKISDLHSSWFARVARSDLNSDTLTVNQPFLKSYFEQSNITQEYMNINNNNNNNNINVYRPNRCDSRCIETLKPQLLERLRTQLDSRLLQIFATIFREEPEDVNWVNSLSEYNEMFVQGNRQRRQVPCKPGKELDEYVDSLFRFASRIVRVMEPFSLPNATIYLPEYNLKVFLYEGGATRAYTLNRKKSAWVHCSNESVSLGLTVSFENLRVKYKYRVVHDWKLLWDGDMEADLAETKLQVQFTQTTPRPEDEGEKVQQRVDRLRIWRLGKVRIIIRGLGNLTQGVALWLSQFLNDHYTQKQLEPSLRRLESEIVSMMNVMLRNLTVPFFTII
ncbi:uncharacterized protein LOC141853652 [Brevipalpus obovatus]|uniref:uncharacterized protein LOC141853652 n=1 Tax=Brevipalpus obovatus TaxID=246614 RepID=UPI003D9F4515